MRIGFIVTDLSNVRIGGISRVATEVGANLAALGHEVIAYVLQREGDKGPSEYRGIQLRYIESFFSVNPDYPVVGFSRRAFKRFSQDAITEHFDLLQSFNLNGIAYPAFQHVLKQMGIPFVMASFETILMDVKAKSREFLSLPSMRTFLQILFESYLAIAHERRYLRKAARIITEDENTRNALAHKMRIPAGMITLIPSGVNVSEAVASQPAILGFKNKRKGPIVGYIGRVDPRKGVQFLIEAMATVVKEFPDAFLFLAGGSRHDYSRRVDGLITKNGLTGCVLRLGRISGDILPYYKAADVIAIPSLSEGIPITLGEAMACGVPVVITRLPGVEPFVQPPDLVHWADIADADSLGKAIISGLKDPAKASRVARGFEFIQGYSWLNVAKRYAAVYQEIIEQKC